MGIEREAMWINFTANRPFAIKIYVGGVNAVSGEPAIEDMSSKIRRCERLAKGKSIQDYVIVPWQKWLDGIATESGKVRQFVAMPTGSGYSVEAQVTGQERMGGIQFEITPHDGPGVLPTSGYYQVLIKTLTGKTITLQVYHGLFVWRLKDQIENKEGVPADMQRLIHAGKQLDGMHCPLEHNFQN